MTAEIGRTAALIRKEMTQFLRDKIMLIIIFYLYTAEVVICAAALSFDVHDLPTALLDFDRSQKSGLLIDNFRSSGYFSIEQNVTRDEEVKEALDRGKVMAAIIIPSDFSKNLSKQIPASVQLLLDGSNANSASVAYGYARRIVQEYALQQQFQFAGFSRSDFFPVDHRTRIWYNSELKYVYFMFLSMIAFAGMMVGVITTAASIVREKESGTIEQIMVTPIRTGELIVAKMLPTLTVGLFALLPSLMIAAFYGVPLRGSLALFFLFSFLFLLSSMGIGVLVAAFAKTQQQALLISFFVLFPVLFLSGTLVPVESMPLGLRYLAHLSPLTHYMYALLGIFLKGVGIGILWQRGAAISLIALVLFGINMLRFRLSLR